MSNSDAAKLSASVMTRMVELGLTERADTVDPSTGKTSPAVRITPFGEEVAQRIDPVRMGSILRGEEDDLPEYLVGMRGPH